MHTLNICTLLVSHNTVLHPLELSGVFAPVSMHAEQAPITLYVTVNVENCPFMAEHFCKLFVELTPHFTKITSTYAALTNCTSNYAFQKRGVSSAQRHSIMNAIANKCHNIYEFTCTGHNG